MISRILGGLRLLISWIDLSWDWFESSVRQLVLDYGLVLVGGVRLRNFELLEPCRRLRIA